MHLVSLAGRLLLLLAASVVASGGQEPKTDQDTEVALEQPEEFTVGFKYKHYRCSEGQVAIYGDYLVIVLLAGGRESAVNVMSLV